LIPIIRATRKNTANSKEKDNTPCLLLYALCAMLSALNNIPRYALFALLIFTPLARGAVQGWAVTVIHMVALIALTAFLVLAIRTGKWKWIKTPLDLPFTCLLALCLLASVFSLHRYTSYWSTILLVNYLTIFYLTIHLTQTRSQLKHLIYVIIGVAVFLCVFGLVKKYGPNPFPWWNYEDLRQGPETLSSTYVNRNHLAGFLEMVLPLLAGLFLLGYSRGIKSLLAYLACLLLAVLVLTLSRGGWIGIILGLAFMSAVLLASRHFRHKGFLITCIGFVFFLSLVVLANTPVVERIRTVLEKSEDLSFRSRLLAWKGVAAMIEDHPYWGTGPGTFSVIFTQYQPPGYPRRFFYAHNDYFHFTSEVGLAVIPIIVWMMIALYRKGFKKLKNPSRLVRGTTLGALSGITAILFHSLVDFNLHIPANAILFTVLAAIVAAPIPKHARTNSKRRSSKPIWQEQLLKIDQKKRSSSSIPIG